MKKRKDSIDNEITRAYSRHAQGKQINIMNIPKVFTECRASILAGGTVDQAVAAAVAKYCTADEVGRAS